MGLLFCKFILSKIIKKQTHLMSQVMSIFSQILQLFHKSEFIQLVTETKSNKFIKGFS